MSLVRSVTTFGNRKLYQLRPGNDNPGLSTSVFSSNNHGVIYAAESYSSKTYDPKHFLDSPPEVIQSSSNALENPLHPSQQSSYQLMGGRSSVNASFADSKIDDVYCNYESEYLEENPDVIQYDEDKMKLKLLELEQRLFDDNNDDDENNMEIDCGWAGSIQYDMLDESPKGSLSSDSNVSTISSNKEISEDITRTPRQLLFDCAVAIQEGNSKVASTIINDLRHRVSIQGDPPERIAAYMVEALAARMATSGKGLYKALKCKEPPSSDRLSAMQVLFEVCPCFRFGFMAANGSMLEAFEGEKRIHIIDFDINQGSQYYTLLQTLAAQPGKPPQIRLTGVDDPESVQRDIGGLKIIGLRLEKLAEDLQIPFEFQAVPTRTAIVTPSVLDCQPGEALVVNFAFQLHHMPDESVSTVNQRDQLLRMVKGLKPKLVTVVEQDVNTNTSPFLSRFAEAYNYYSAVFESLDATLPRDSQDRMNVERHCLARDIINIVACEGEERIERYEVAGKWRARMMMAGFSACPISRDVNDVIGKLIKQYSERYKVKEEMGALHFGWEEKILIVASAWR